MIEAKIKKTGLKEANILGVNAAISDMNQVLKTIEQIIEKKPYNRPYFIITAYSETFLETLESADFRRAVEAADLVVGDGVSVWAAADLVSRPRSGWLKDFMRGLAIGGKVISGRYSRRPQGVQMFRGLLADKQYKKFLFGGFNGVAGRLAAKYGCGWSEEDDQVVDKINEYGPDILFVALGRFKQEIWIANNLGRLKVKLVMGVGSAFDEVAGEGVWRRPVPGWVSKAGLKWLWRVMGEPKHLVRAWRAFPVFPLKVFGWYESRG